MEMSMRTSTELEVEPLAGLYKALGDPTRLRIVALLVNGELCVCHLQHVLGLPQAHVSRHLAVLRAAGVVEARREGSWIHYRLREQDDRDRARQLRALTEAYASRDALRRDVKRIRGLAGPSCGEAR
jgi:ArsR family transcriptional regulator, arsenate/arsenite/antimonite-responsive transcriptional repressor